MYSAYIDGKWINSNGASLKSYNPATGKVVWEGLSATHEDVVNAIEAAKKALPIWSSKTIEERKKYLQSYGQLLKSQHDKLSEAISIENGKPLWESRAEVTTMFNKIDITIKAYEERCKETSFTVGETTSITRRHPHGIVGVLGPFNFPGHLTNGQIIPALLAGNTIVFKPSELTPYFGQLMIELFEKASFPPGVINLVQGGKEVGISLVEQKDLNALLFVGSWDTGKLLATSFGSAPQKMLALEMGGNNPLVVSEINDIEAAAYLTIQSSYLTSGQRCTCARRLIVPKGKKGDAFIDSLRAMIKNIAVGPYTQDPEPYMGPVISEHAANKLLEAQENLKQKGATSLIEMKKIGSEGSFLSPGLIDVTGISDIEDKENFGPLLQLIRVEDFTSGIIEANKTSYGLTAGLLSDSKEEYELFLEKTNAGIINWNVPLTGNSSSAPFGGIGKSGNFRPSGYYSVDYCSYPVASLELPTTHFPEKLAPGLPITKKSE